MSFTIRSARGEDAARLTVLMRETFLAAYAHCSSVDNVNGFLDATYAVPVQRAELADTHLATLIAETERGDWAGYAQLRFASATKDGVTLARPVELGRLYLLPRFHGQGIGDALMARLVALARARGGDGLWLNAWDEALQALRFYARHGFKVVGRTVFRVADDAKDNVVMQRRFGESIAA
jgi:GNAT superfamily N-acetyltransferase